GFLAGRAGVEAARRAWQATPQASRQDALLMGAALTQALTWLAKRREDLSGVDQGFIDQSGARERKTRARARRAQALIYVLLGGVILRVGGPFKLGHIQEEVTLELTKPALKIPPGPPSLL